MFLLYTGYVAIFYLFLCVCIVRACAVFGCIVYSVFNECAWVGDKDECSKHARRKDKDQWTEVLMHFLLWPQNDWMQGRGGGCALWCGGKSLSCLTNTQHLFLLSPYRHHPSSVSRSMAQSLLACPACFEKVCQNCLFSYCAGQKTVALRKNDYPWTVCVQHLPLALLGAWQS